MNDINRKLNNIVWHTMDIETKFNFVDIIKGIIPITFSEKLRKIRKIRKLLFII
jgi:hypothetical protein